MAFNNSIENYENTQYSVANGELKSLLEALKSTIVLYSGSTNSVLSYKSGDLINKTQVLDLYNKVQSSIEYVENNKEEIELVALNQQEVFSQMQKDYEEALEAREDEGRVKIITGALAVVVGGAAIILTAGAATPIVVTAVVTGLSSAAYGVSNIQEGKEDIYYASIGDLNSVAINPIRDTVFMGNQGAYNLWGNINMAVAGLCIPVSQAVNGVAGASKSIIAKEAVKAIGKEASFAIGVDWASSNITNFAAGELELNQTESTLLNLGLNFGIGIGGYKLRTKFFGEASFAKGMSYDDAKRYNDYWKQVESGNNTGYPGLSDADVKIWKFADNKLNNHIALNKVDFNEVVKLRLKELELENSLRGVDKGVSKADNFATIKKVTAEETNSWWKNVMGYDNPPYKPGTIVEEIKLTKDTTFVRVYDGEVSGMYGGWVMKAEDIAGLTPKQIQDKFALPSLPKYMADVKLTEGITIRTGVVNPLEGWGKGGGIQYDLMGQRVGEFLNPRELP